MRLRSILLISTLLAAFASLGTASTYAQTTSPFGDPMTRQPMHLSTWPGYIAPPEPKEFEVNDLLTVEVQRRTLTISEGEVDRKKKAHGKYALTDWILFNGLAVVPDPQTAGTPTVGGTIDEKYKAEADLEYLNAIEFTIKCKIVEKRENGLLVISGDDFSQINGETWSVKYSGMVQADDILPGNTVLSEDVYMQWIEKNETGVVRDGYSRGWLQHFFDFAKPF